MVEERGRHEWVVREAFLQTVPLVWGFLETDEMEDILHPIHFEFAVDVDFRMGSIRKQIFGG